MGCAEDDLGHDLVSVLAPSQEGLLPTLRTSKEEVIVSGGGRLQPGRPGPRETYLDTEAPAAAVLEAGEAVRRPRRTQVVASRFAKVEEGRC
jgi:hypothetical protein